MMNSFIQTEAAFRHFHSVTLKVVQSSFEEECGHIVLFNVCQAHYLEYYL